MWLLEELRYGLFDVEEAIPGLPRNGNPATIRIYRAAGSPVDWEPPFVPFPLHGGRYILRGKGIAYFDPAATNYSSVRRSENA